MNAALYIRLSKEDDHDGPSESVTNQKSLLTGFAEENGFTVHDIYIDDGWSGCNFDRPAFRRLIGDIETGKVDTVITKDLSRLGRDYILTGHYLERYFPEHRIRYISLLDGIDTATDSSANDITPFRAIMNDMYAKDISKKITSVKRSQQRRGLFIGGKPVYGYRKHPSDKNRLIVDEDAAMIVRRIFSMACSGTSCREIASTLNREHIPPPALYAGLTITSESYTGLWNGERISEMLQNETYIGNMVQGRRIKSSYKSRKCLRQRKEDWVVVENTHEPLIGRAEFEAVQKLLAGRLKTRVRTYDHPLKGLIFCHECGHPLGIVNRKKTNGDDTLYFICRTYQRSASSRTCTSHCIKAQTVTELIAQKITEICTSYSPEQDLLSMAQDEIHRRAETHLAVCDPTQLQKRVDALNAKLDRVYLDYLGGLIDTEDFSRIKIRLQKERSTLQDQLSKHTPQTPSADDSESIAKQLVYDFTAHIGSDRAILTHLIDRIELTARKEIIISFKFSADPTSG